MPLLEDPSEIEPCHLHRPDDETDPERQKHGKLRIGPQRFYKPIDHLIPQGVSRTAQALLRLPVRLVVKRYFNRSYGILVNQARPTLESGAANDYRLRRARLRPTAQQRRTLTCCDTAG